MWTCWHGWERRRKGWAGFLHLSLFFFFFFLLSRLSLHAQCHILIPHNSKLIRDNACLVETFPLKKWALFLSFSLPLSLSLFRHVFLSSTQFLYSIKLPNIKVILAHILTCCDYLTTNDHCTKEPHILWVLKYAISPRNKQSFGVEFALLL